MKQSTLFAACVGAAALLSVGTASAQDCRTEALAGSWTWGTLDSTCYLNIDADGSFRGRCLNAYWDEDGRRVVEVDRVRGEVEVDAECRFTGLFNVLGEPGQHSSFTGRVWGITSDELVAGNVAFTRRLFPGGGVMVRD